MLIAILIIIALIVSLLLLRPLFLKLLNNILSPHYQRIATEANDQLARIIRTNTTHTKIIDMTVEELRFYQDHGIFLDRSVSSEWRPMKTLINDWVNFFYIKGLPIIIPVGRGFYVNKKSGEIKAISKTDIDSIHQGFYYAGDDQKTILEGIDDNERRYRQKLPKAMQDFLSINGN